MSADPIEPAHDGPDPEPVEEPATVEPGDIVELPAVDRWSVSRTPPAGTRGTVTAVGEHTAIVRVLVHAEFTVALSELRRCD